MTTVEKKNYIKEAGKARLVKELVCGLDMTVEDAVDYVYNQLTMTADEFKSCYSI